MGKSGKSKNYLRKIIDREFKISIKHIRDSKNFIYSIIGLFVFFAIMGYLIQLPDSLSSQIIDYFRKIVMQTKGLGWFDLISFLFVNNSVSGFLGLFLGFFFGILPVFSIIANGFILGFVANIAVSSEGILSLWRLFPHGIFELPAIFISFGLGLKLSTFIFEKHKWDSLRNLLKKSVSAYVFVILPLLVIAAIIEGTLIFLGA